MPINCPRILACLPLFLLWEGHASAASITDQIKWPPGQVPVGQTNGPDTLDDIWQGLFNAWALDPDGDEDKDGCKNIVESIAGTNPFNAGDCFKIGHLSISAGNVVITTKVEAGKKYKVLSSPEPNGPVWSVETLQVPVVGPEYVPEVDQAEVFLSVAKSAGSRLFYKLETADVSTSGDGVSDWVKRKLGLNPLVTDSNGDGVSDVDEILMELQTPPDVVSVVPGTAFVSEDGGPPGQIKLRRNRSLLGATVFYTLGGTAVAGVDFQALTGSVYFAPGAREANIYITPNADNAVEGGESVTVTLTSAASSNSTPLDIAAANQYSVIIQNSTVPSGTGLLARYYDQGSTTYAHASNFGDSANYAFTRGTPTTQGTIVVTPTTGNLSTILNAVSVGTQVKLTFLGGNLNNALYNHLNYPVTAKTGTNFTVSINAEAALPTSSSSTSNFSIQPFHPAVVERVDPVVNNEWMGGTPNGVAVAAAAGTTATNVPDNYSDTFEMYLQPATAGSYRFQLDADDKARVLLDLNNNGTFDLPGEQIVEHGWDGPATVGTFNISGSYSLSIPASAAQRLKMRVEHVETTGEARCRLQWSRDGGTFANIPQAEQFTHTSAMTYSFTRSASPVTTGTATITLTGHGLTAGNTVSLAFSSGNLFTPNTIDANGYSSAYTVATVPTSSTFTVALTSTGSTLPATGTGSGFVEGFQTSTTTGAYNKTYTNTTFANTPGRIGVDAAVTTSNNGLWGTGTPDAVLINPDTFTARWTGQVQPQFTEEYTFVVQADDACLLKVNGQVQEMRPVPATDSGGSTYSYEQTSGNTVVTYSAAVIKPDSFVVGETVRLNPTSGNLNYSSGSTYSYDDATGDAVITYSSMTNFSPGGFKVGETVFLDPTSGSLTSLASLPYVITAASDTTFTVNFGTGVFATGTGNLNILDTLDLVVSAVTATTFTVNHGPGKAPTTTGNMNIDIVNKPLKDWAVQTNERFVRLPVIGGTRYDIQLDYYEGSGFARCNLYWFSPSQPKQIIPAERLYPASVTAAPAAHISATEAAALVGGAFSYLVQGSNGAAVSVSGNPAWLNYNDGVLSGTPPSGSAGDFQIILTITNADGTSTSLINLHVEDTGSTINREFWNGVAGTSIASIPTSTPPTGSGALATLAAPTDFGDNFGARIRGYITAPVTGNYYFWIAASHAAELWISNDDETVNAFKRASVVNGTAVQEWSNAGETNQRSPWLALEAGQRYYIEILHKAGVGSDHLAIGWAKPGESGNAPSQIVPGYVLSPYVPPAPGTTPGTLYVSTMLAQNGAVTNGVGNSTLRLSADETSAVMRYTYTGLTGPITSQHIHTDAYLNKPSTIVYDIDTPATPGDGLITTGPDAGAYKWTITPVGTLSSADIIEIIKQGKAYINLHTATYPNGEIRGNYTLGIGSRTFSPPPPPPTWTDDHTTDVGAVRFLTQATYGPNIADIAALKAMPSYEAWIDDQFAKAASDQLPEVLRTEFANAQGGAFSETLTFNAWWRNSITGEDQLRQRIAFALSEIHVVSAQGPLLNNARALSYFYDKLAANAFGNFRQILEDTTLTPSMGRYLDMLRNDKPDLAVGRIPNENYAREIKQLFSVGLYRMWPDGTLMLNSKDSPIDTYSQREIVGFSHVFTGWDYGYDGAFRTALNAVADWTRLMREVPARHFTGVKRVLNNEVLPGIATLGGQPLDPYATHNTTHYNQPAYQNLAAQELTAAHDQLFHHPNVGPFICRQLIQRLVTSHPSRDYLYRVVQKFNDNGSGVRGDMKAVIKAILLDYDARSATEVTKSTYGKQREPVMRVAAAARAFRPDTFSGTYSQSGDLPITVTTSTPHKLASGNQVFLDFASGAPAPYIGSYAVSGTPANATTFVVNALGWATGTYSIPANSTTCTVTMSNHWLQAGHQVFMKFRATGAVGPVVSGVAGLDNTVYTLLTATPETGTNGTFTFTISAGLTNATARTGNMMVPRFSPGSYTTAASGLPAPNDRRVFMDTNTDHHLNIGDQVQLNFYGGNPQPVDMVVTVESVVDLNTYTFTAPAAGTNLGTTQGFNSVYQFPLVSQPLTRNGNVASRPGTFNMGNTVTDLDQSPINSPTVFNYYLPDFKNPGTLASQGITTPEFQTTAETTVIRQANFLFNGIYLPTNNLSIASFKTGSNALVMDFSPWIGNATDLGLGAGSNITKPWTNDVNLDALIAQLSTLLTADQLSASVKTIIKNHVLSLTRGRQISSLSTNAAYTTVNTPVAHNLTNGTSVTITGVTGGTFGGEINATHVISNVATTSFRVPIPYTDSTGISVANARVSTSIPYDNVGTPPDGDKRDRLNAIIHLILTSPDFTIQR